MTKPEITKKCREWLNKCNIELKVKQPQVEIAKLLTARNVLTRVLTLLES